MAYSACLDSPSVFCLHTPPSVTFEGKNPWISLRNYPAQVRKAQDLVMKRARFMGPQQLISFKHRPTGGHALWGRASTSGLSVAAFLPPSQPGTAHQPFTLCGQTNHEGRGCQWKPQKASDEACPHGCRGSCAQPRTGKVSRSWCPLLGPLPGSLAVLLEGELVVRPSGPLLACSANRASKKKIGQ